MTLPWTVSSIRSTARSSLPRPGWRGPCGAASGSAPPDSIACGRPALPPRPAVTSPAPVSGSRSGLAGPVDMPTWACSAPSKPPVTEQTRSRAAASAVWWGPALRWAWTPKQSKRRCGGCSPPTPSRRIGKMNALGRRPSRGSGAALGPPTRGFRARWGMKSEVFPSGVDGPSFPPLDGVEPCGDGEESSSSKQRSPAHPSGAPQPRRRPETKRGPAPKPGPPLSTGWLRPRYGPG
jgi:hypothetical protein